MCNIAKLYIILALKRTYSVLFCILSVFGLHGCNDGRDYRWAKPIKTNYALVDSSYYTKLNFYLDSLERARPLEDFSHASRPRQIPHSPIIVYSAPSRSSIKDNISFSDSIWHERQWHSKYSRWIYRTYVLPLKSGTESFDSDWRRQSYYDWSRCAAGDSPEEMAEAIMREVPFGIYSMFRGVASQNYNHYKRFHRGTCDDYCIYATQILRAQGIPTSIDIIPCWGSHDLGHAFNSIIGPNGETVCSFNSGEGFQKFDFEHKVPKVYRQLSINVTSEDSPEQDIPSLFSDRALLDVTSSFDIPSSDVLVPSKLKRNSSRFAYLAVYRRSSWAIVARGDKKGKGYLFKDVGSGYLHNRTTNQSGEAIGDGILYLPVIYKNGHITPFNSPFILSSDGAVSFISASSQTDTISLTRKYPRFRRIVSFANELVGGVFEVANKADFSDAVTVYTIKQTPSSRVQTICLDKSYKCRYLRFRKPRGGFSLAEIIAFDNNGMNIASTPVSLKGLMLDTSLNNICDGNVLSFFSCQGEFHNLWIGIDLQYSQTVSSFSFCPRTDDNDITIGDVYELFMWGGNKWQSYGRRIAGAEIIEYNDVPTGGLYLLKDISRGKEERPFTIEEGKQIWW